MGRGSTDTLRGGALPKIHTVDAWDGKDGQVSGSRSDGCGPANVLVGVWSQSTAVKTLAGALQSLHGCTSYAKNTFLKPRDELQRAVRSG